MITHIRDEVYKLKDCPHTDATVYNRFLARINPDLIEVNKHYDLTHEKNPQSHLCCFTLPLDRINKSIFLGHHIKADDWIPPGGHIDEGETPMQTVRREFSEELDYQITHEPIMLFDLSIKTIDNPKYLCKEHYDLWYAVETGKKQFRIDKGEFYDGGWFSYDKALFQIKTPFFRRIIGKFLSRLRNK